MAAEFAELDPEAALIVLGDHVTLGLVAFIEEGDAEREAQIAEDVGVLRPHDDRPGRHDGRDVAGHEAVPGEAGEADHGMQPLPAFGGIELRALGQDDAALVLGGEVVELGDDRPAVHLALIDLLRAVIEARRVAQAHRVGGGEEAERLVGPDHLVLVEQRHPPLRLEDALDDEHDVGPAGVVLVEHEGHGALQRPGQEAFAILRDLLAVAQDDRILADQVDTADVTVQVDADARPVQVGGDLLDMGRLPRAVIALDHDPAVVGEAGEDGQRRVVVELIARIDVRRVGGAPLEGRHVELRVETEDLGHRQPAVGHLRQLRQVVELGLGGLGKHDRCSRNERADAHALCSRDAPAGKDTGTEGDDPPYEKGCCLGTPVGFSTQA